MYILTDDFLFDSEVCTSIKFEKSDKFEYFIDSNSRSFVITYTDGMKYSDLNIPKFTSLSDKLISESTILLNRSDIIINGIRYRVKSDVKFISCYILDGNYLSKESESKLSESNIINYENGSIFLLINSNKMDLSAREFVEWLNTSGYINAELLDESKFSISNFEAVDTKYSCDVVYDNTKYEYYGYKFHIDESDVVSDFIRFLQEEFPEYDIFNAVTDDSTQRQKTKMLVYSAKLADNQSEQGTRIIKHPIYGRMIQARIVVNWEFLTDDLKELIAFKNKLMVDKELFLATEFKLYREDVDWYYTINWLPDISAEIERSPQTKVLSDTLLYNTAFSCELIGWIVEENVHMDPIMYPITRFYTERWMLIGSLFDHSDPNVRWSTIIPVGKTYYIIQEGVDKKIYLTNLQTKELMADLSIKEVDGEIKILNSDGTESDLYFPFTTEKPVSPLDLPHGVDMLNHLVRQVVKFESDDIVIPDTTDKSKLKYIINLRNYKQFLEWRKKNGIH
jgi:hypothetical protein